MNISLSSIKLLLSISFFFQENKKTNRSQKKMNLKIHNVSLSIKGRLIVNDVSITVNPGEVVGLMGLMVLGKLQLLILQLGT